MPNPKRRHSKQRTAKRRSHDFLTPAGTSNCPNCGEKKLAGEFDLIFRPEGIDAEAGEHAITEDETEIGYYEESGLLLEDAVREQVLLTLPGRTLCQDDCKGLCAHCGQNLNLQTCSCNPISDPRWNALAGLASTIESS